MNLRLRLRSALARLALCIPLALASTFAQAQEYLFDILAKPAYLKSWNALFAGEKNVDAWLGRYAKTKDGPASPGKRVTLGGAAHYVGNVCKTHDCGDNRFFVLFTADGTKAWGLLVRNGTTERFFGNPDDARKDALRAAARS